MESNYNYDFSLLPPHVITQVLLHLKFRDRLKAAQLCRSWYYASCDPNISKNICVRILDHRRLDRIGNLTRPFVKVVLTIDFNKFNYKEFFVKFGQQLHEVAFNSCEFNVEQLVDCLGYLPNISTLEMLDQFYVSSDVSYLFQTSVNKMAMERMYHSLASVKTLRIEADSLQLDFLRLILSGMVNLEHLEYSTSYDVFDPLVEYIQQFGELKLRYLMISYSVGANFLKKFRKYEKQLSIHTLIIRCLDDEDTHSNDFGLFCKKLSNLRVFSTTLNQNQLIDICCYLTNLVELEIQILNTRNIYNVRTLQTLKKLTITSNIYRGGDDDDEDLIKLFSTPLVNLQQLHMTHRTSHAVLQVLCQNYKHLNGLKLSGLRTLNIDAIYKNLVNLKSLEIYFYIYPMRIDDIEVETNYDISNLKLLEELDINRPVAGATWDIIKILPKLMKVSRERLELNLNKGYVDPFDEDTFGMMQNMFD